MLNSTLCKVKPVKALNIPPWQRIERHGNLNLFHRYAAMRQHTPARRHRS